MPSTAVKERLTEDIGLWQADGIISAETCAVLRERYAEPGFGMASFVRSLGFGGAISGGLGVLGLIGALTGSVVVGALMAAGIATGFFWLGLRLSADPRGRTTQSAKAILALAVMAQIGATSALAQVSGLPQGTVIVVTGIVSLPIIGILSYRFNNGFLLVIGLLLLVQWVGSWNEMVGRSTYEFAVEDPRVMALIAVCLVGVGRAHELRLGDRYPRFYQVYETIGLVYFNVSLLILSIYPEKTALPYIALFTVAGIAQIVVGARWKSGLLVGFGVTALAVDLFTRYYERMWAQLDKGLFFLLGGALLFGAGFGLERLLAQRPRSA